MGAVEPEECGHDACGTSIPCRMITTSRSTDVVLVPDLSVHVRGLLISTSWRLPWHVLGLPAG